ncbi:MAG: TetR family transcriptional regulator [Chloroflexi bacterium]|nr:TetR family transcriptional regulator [Chloroflexota bacterium]
MNETATGRQNQKERTRRAIVAAAARLIEAGTLPSTAAVAEAALVSPATAYRYFPDHLTLLTAGLREASTGLAVRFRPELGDREDPVERIDAATAAMLERVLARERLVRAVLALSLLRSVDGSTSTQAAAELRPGLRHAWIDEALRSLEDRLDPAQLRRLKLALGVIMGPEALIALQDVMHVDTDEAIETCRWMARTLTTAMLP